MPIIRNPNGRLVCVTEAAARYHLSDNPQKLDYDGKVAKKGYTVVKDADEARDEYLTEVADCAQKAADQAAADLAQREASSFSVAKGLAKAMGLGKQDDEDENPKRSRRKKVADE